jgi:hypothetical protein
LKNEDISDINIKWKRDSLSLYHICEATWTDWSDNTRHIQAVKVTDDVFSSNVQGIRYMVESQLRDAIKSRLDAVAENIDPSNFWDALSKL